MKIYRKELNHPRFFLFALLMALFIGRTSSAQLTMTKTLWQAKHSAAAAAVGSKVFFGGGIDIQNKGVKVVDIYDNTTNTWDTIHLSQGRYELTAAGIGSKVFFAGGDTGSGLSDVIDIYDANDQSRAKHKLTGGGRQFLVAASAGTKVLFAGGKTATGYSADVDIYDNGTGQWTTTTLPGGARCRFAAASAGNKVFFAGGETGPGAITAIVDIYDASTSTWTQETLPSGARYFLVAAAVDNKVFFAGGRTLNPNPSNVVDIYDTNTETWITSTHPLSQARFDFCAATAGTKVFFAGGQTSSSTSAVVDIYDNSNGSWTEATLSAPRNSIAATSVGTKAFFGGGYQSGAATVVDNVDIFFPIPTITNENFIDVLNKGESPKTSIMVDEPSNISTVNFRSRGISEGDSPFKSSVVTSTGDVYEKTFTGSDLSDLIGLEYYFEIIDQAGRSKVSSKQVAHNYYAEGAAEQVIPTLKAGTSADSYQLISVPLELTDPAVLSVFKDFPGDQYDITQWRLFDYGIKDGKRTNREYPDFTSIAPGIGYWLITKAPVTINVGKGSAVHAAQDTPAEINLVSGWNLIGNPYNYTISWQEVLTYNNSPAGVDAQVGVFNSGTNVDPSGTLGRYQGAFVHSTSAMTLKIPVKRNLDLGRIGSQEVDLSKENWQLPLVLTDGVLTNRLGGIGMNFEATKTGKDKFDALNFPMLEGIGMSQIEFPHPEVFANFCREIVATGKRYIWDFAIRRRSDMALTLTWDNEVIVEGDQNLFLFDPSAKVMINMRTNSSYLLPESANSLQVLFGDLDFINQKMDELLPVFAHPYPNPTSEDLTIPFRIPATAGKVPVSVNVYDMLGRPVATLTDGIFQKGAHDVTWRTEGRSGMFIVEMNAGTVEKIRVKVQVE